MKLNTEKKKEYALSKKDKRIDRQTRKKVWSNKDDKYCEECFYQIFQDEEHVCSSIKNRGKINPQMWKILKERKENSKKES